MLILICNMILSFGYIDIYLNINGKKEKKISPHCTSLLFKDQLYHYPNKEWFIEKENEVLGVNLKSIMGQAKLKLEKYNYTQVQEIKKASERLNDMKNVRVAGVVKFCEFKTAKNGKFFLLDRNSLMT